MSVTEVVNAIKVAGSVKKVTDLTVGEVQDLFTEIVDALHACVAAVRVYNVLFDDFGGQYGEFERGRGPQPDAAQMFRKVIDRVYTEVKDLQSLSTLAQSHDSGRPILWHMSLLARGLSSSLVRTIDELTHTPKMKEYRSAALFLKHFAETTLPAYESNIIALDSWLEKCGMSNSARKNLHQQALAPFAGIL